jgi:transcriptional regulator with XRE-family HTH domain
MRERTAGSRRGPTTPQTTVAFGELLRRWRVARSLSQLALAVETEVSARHLSFLETGRALPSREMVLRLAAVLDVPLRERNALLTAAGYAPIYRESALGAPELDQVRRALDFMLARQEPYPALVVDRLWNILRQNEGAGRVIGLFLDPGAAIEVPGPPNVVRMTFHPRGLRPYVENWETVAGPLMQQLHREAAGGVSDEGARGLLDEILAYPGVPARWRTPDPAALSTPVLPLALRRAAVTARFFTTITTLGTPNDITLQELRVESFFPADRATEDLARRLVRP